MTIDTYIGEDERAVRVDYDYQPAERDTNTPEAIIVNGVYCIEHERQTGKRADELGLLDAEELERITLLCRDDCFR